LYLQFQTVVLLNWQMRITNNHWTHILHRARTGDCSADDINTIQQLVLTDSECTLPDFGNPPWDDAILITPRKSLQTYWNEAASMNTVIPLVTLNTLSTQKTLFSKGVC
jgi:hypothetical protein